MSAPTTTRTARSTHPPADAPARRWASIQTAAKYVDCEHKTIRRMIARGELAAYPLGPQLLRVDLDELDALLATAASGRAIA